MRRQLIINSDPQGINLPRFRRIVTANLVSWWDFVGGFMTTTLVDRIGGKDGRINFATTGVFWQYGKGQGAFDGIDEFVDVGVLSGILPALTTDFSFDVWFKTTANTNGFHAILGSSFGNGTLLHLMIERDSGNKIEFFLRDEQGDRLRIASATQVNDGKWHHVACTKSGNTANDMAIYLEGSLLSTSVLLDETFDDTLSTQVLYLGARFKSNGTDHHLAGEIGSTRTYNRALSAAEVAQNYSAERRFYGK